MALPEASLPWVRDGGISEAGWPGPGSWAQPNHSCWFSAIVSRILGAGEDSAQVLLACPSSSHCERRPGTARACR